MSCVGERAAKQWSQGVEWEQMECMEEMPVPPHLQSLFEAATAKCSKAEQEGHKSVTKQLPGVCSPRMNLT